MATQFDLLSRSPGDRTAYTEMCKAVLAFLIFFNRRRSDETAKLKMATVRRSGRLGDRFLDNGVSKELMTSLSHFEKKLVRNLKRIETHALVARNNLTEHSGICQY